MLLLRLTLLAAAVGLLACMPAAIASAPPLNGPIAFESTRDGNNEIYLMAADGSVQHNISLNAANDHAPALSPDGTRVAFYTYRDSSTLSSQIYVMGSDGSSPTRLTNVPMAYDDFPTWSPDGGEIAFTSDRVGAPSGNFDIWAMGADGSSPHRLTTDPAIDSTPSWSPDGTRIAFRSFRDGNNEIYVMRADGTAETRLTNDPGFDDHAAWSPDGAHILFDRSPDGGTSNLWIMDADGSHPTQLTFSGYSNYDGAWSPDGTQIAFTSDRDGNEAVFVMNADGSNQHRVTDATAFNSAPTWGPRFDTQAPTVTIKAPVEASHVARGATVFADFACADEASGSGVASCEGTSARGAPLDTTVPGSYEFAVTARDRSGNTTTARSHWVVDARPAATPSVSITAARFDVHFRASRASGAIVVVGSANVAGVLALALQRAGHTRTTVHWKLPPGPFTRRANIPPTLLPGPYTLVPSTTAGDTYRIAAPVVVTLNAPPEGVVARAWISATRHGAPTLQILGHTGFYVFFQLANRPHAGRAIRLSFYAGRRLWATLLRPNLPIVWAEEPIPPFLRGRTWHVRIVVGNTLLKQVNVLVS